MLKKPKRFAYLFIAVIAAIVFAHLYSRAFPLATVDLAINRTEALNCASNFLREKGHDPHNFEQAVVFQSNYYSSTYLQSQGGVKALEVYSRQGVPVWYWRVRFFKELEKKSFIVDVDPSKGRVVRFTRYVLNNTPGASLSQDEAKVLALEELTQQGIDLTQYELYHVKSEKQEQRIDHEFMFEKREFSVGDAKLVVRIRIQGEKLGEYSIHLKVPEEFVRRLSHEVNLGKLLTKVSDTVKTMLFIGAIFFFFSSRKKITLHWRRWLIVGTFVGGARLINFFNNLPLLWHKYYDTMSKSSFFMTVFQDELLSVFYASLIVFASGIMAEFIIGSRLRKEKGPKYFCFERILTPNDANSALMIGYCLALAALAYLSLFYYFGTRYFGIWLFPNTQYSNILGSYLPMLFPLALAVSAAVQEEFVFRFFAVTFMKRLIRSTFFALVIAALLWGFAHSFYLVFPMYVRGIELAILGIVFGYVFLRYGILSVLIAHYVINLSLASMPLLQSGDSHLRAAGIFVIICSGLPILFVRMFIQPKLSKPVVIDYSI